MTDEGDRPDQAPATRSTRKPRRSRSSRRRRRREAPEKAGKLKPANPFELIRLLARSQHDPRKAVAELVQNSLDAGARHVVVTRHQHRGTKMISVRDDGAGVLPELSRREALSYIATHIGHSRKRDLSPEDRYKLLLQGKYGIGLLGFWSVGKVLEMRSKVGDELALVLRLTEDSPRYEVLKDRRELELSDVWTEVVVKELHVTASRHLSGRRLAEYLAKELRGQLLQRDVDLRVVDRLARGRTELELPVVPPRFPGVPLDELTSLRVAGFGPEAQVELCYLGPGERDEAGRVSLHAGGTLIADDIAAIDGFDHAPWTGGQLVGLIDFAGLDVAPGSRRGFIPNAAAEAFRRALPRLERAVEQRLEAFAEERQREREESLARQLRRLFGDYGRRLPELDLLELKAAKELSVPSSSAVRRRALADGETGGPQSELFFPGPLASLELVPREPLVEVEHAHRLRVVARDASGRRLTEGISLEGSLRAGGSLAGLSPAADPLSLRFEAGSRPGLVELVVEGSCAGGGAAELRAVVEICEDLALARRLERGIPEPQPVQAPGERWRSRVVDERWEVNAGHQDYVATAESGRARLRYVASLLAKEMALRSQASPEVEEALERMLQILSWVERRL